jgi:hypothetical protein
VGSPKRLTNRSRRQRSHCVAKDSGLDADPVERPDGCARLPTQRADQSRAADALLSTVAEYYASFLQRGFLAPLHPTQQAKSQQAPLFRKVCHQLLAPRSLDGSALPGPFEKAMFDLRRQLHDASLGLPPAMNVHNNIPSSDVTRQAAQRCTRCARLREGICQDATKHANRGLGTMGQDGSTCLPHLVVLITTGNR